MSQKAATGRPRPAGAHSPTAGAALLAVALGAGLAFAMAAPVLRSPSTRVFGTELVGRHYDPFAAMARFAAPFHLDAFTQPVTDLPGHWLAALAGPVAAYNLVVLLSFPLSALTAFLFAWYLTGSRVASVVAALAFAFSPFHLAQAAYHPQIAQTQWVPLYFLALLWALDRPAPVRLALLAGAALTLTFSNFYAGLIGAVLTPVALLAWWRLPFRGPRSAPSQDTRGASPAPRSLTLARVVHSGARSHVNSIRGPLVVGAGLLLAAGATILGARLAVPHVLAGWEHVAFPRADLFRYSAKWWAYLMPPAANRWLGTWSLRRWAAFGIGPGLLEEQVSLGWSAVLLAAVPVWRWIRGERESRLTRAVPFLAVLAAAALVCSLSPQRQIGPIMTIRPSYFLYMVAPMFRSYARFGVVVQLAVAVLAGAGAALLLERRGWPRTAIAVLLLCGLGMEYAPFPPWPWRPALPGEALPWVASQRPPVRLFVCEPPDPADTTFLPSLLGHPVSFLGDRLDDCGRPELAAKLSAEGFTEVLVPSADQFGRWFARRALPAGVQRVRAFRDGLVLRVTAPVPPVLTDRLTGYYAREYLDDRTWRWMAREGRWTVTNTTGAAVDATLSVELTPFPAPRRLAVALDGAALPDLQLAEGRHVYTIGPLRLAAGRNLLTFTAREPAVVAAPLAHNHDSRKLSAAVGEWRWQVNARGRAPRKGPEGSRTR